MRSVGLLAMLLMAAGCDSTRGPVQPAGAPSDAPLAPAADASAGDPGRDSIPPAVEAADPFAAWTAAADSADATSDTEASASTGEPMRDPDTLYESWVQPEFVLVLTGQQHGYIEPCGCTGLTNQKGGLARRHSLLRSLAERSWPLVVIDAGNQVRRYGRQAEIKFQVSADALRQMGYDLVALGADDLRLSSLELVRLTADETQSALFYSANAAIFDAELTPQYKIVERGEHKIGITAVVGDEWLAGVKNADIVTKTAAEAIKQVLPDLEAADCDLKVLVAHATLDESRALGTAFPQFDIVVTAGGQGDPTFQPERLAAGPLLIRVGVKAMHVGLVGVFSEGDRLRYQRLPLTDKYPDSPQMLDSLATYQDHLRELGLSGLGLRPLPHPTNRNFVGSKACQECHETAYAKWATTGHFRATESLIHPYERSEIPRHYDPECLSCHVTGWNAQNYRPYQSGYLGEKETPLMHSNGCENCHGPGSQHVAAELGDEDVSEEERLARVMAMRLPLAKAEQECMKCHDLDNSPDFHVDGAFEEYWEKIQHYE